MAGIELNYSIGIAVNRVLTETEKNKLMIALGDAVHKVLGETKNGTVLIYSEPKE